MESLDVAKYVVTKCVDDGCPISNLQLQKILYYIQKEFLHSKGSPFFSESIEAWQFGPVVPNVYYHFCGFGAMLITSRYDTDVVFDKEDREMIDSIIESKRVLNPWDLVEETHAPNGAWKQIYGKGEGNRKIIPNSLIRAEGRS